MDRNLLRKYFRNRCSEEEIEQVLHWFQTDEGKDFLEKDLDRENRQFINGSELFLYPQINSEQIFNRIQRHKQQDSRRSHRFWMRVASIVLVVAIICSLLYWGDYMTLKEISPEPVLVTYMTEPGQQKIFTLADGSVIRLNEESSLMVPDKLIGRQRKVELKGEAYFEVAHDPVHSFVVETKGSTVEVLGTKFNVKADSLSNNVEVAVIEGKVSLKRDGAGDTASALLTRNTFGILRLSDSQITIEKINTQNYLSWINNRLVFSGETLAEVSRQLERLYDIEITFASERYKKLELTADIGKTDLQNVLSIVSNTFGISYRRNGHAVVWTES